LLTQYVATSFRRCSITRAVIGGNKGIHLYTKAVIEIARPLLVPTRESASNVASDQRLTA
jgi:hypothetical protein